MCAEAGGEETSLYLPNIKWHEKNQKENKKLICTRSSLVTQWMKDPVLSMLWLQSLLWRRFDPWPRNFHMMQVRPKKINMHTNIFLKREKRHFIYIYIYIYIYILGVPKGGETEGYL